MEMATDAASDASCSSVDQFLRDNSFSIGEGAGDFSAAELDEGELTASDSGAPGAAHDEDDGDVVALASVEGSDSRAKELDKAVSESGARHDPERRGLSSESSSGSGSLASSALHASGVSLSGLSASRDDSSASTPPRFVLLGDDDLMLVDRHHTMGRHGPSEAGSSTGERDASQPRATAHPQQAPPPHSEPEYVQVTDVHEVDDSLDRSMLLGRSVLSGSSSASFLEPSSLDSAHEFDLHVAQTPSNRSEQRESADLDTTSEFGAVTSTPTTPEGRLPSIYQMTPQADRVSVSSSSLSSVAGRSEDLELSHALGVETPTPAPTRTENAGASDTNKLGSDRQSEPTSSRQSATLRDRNMDDQGERRPPRLQRALFSSGVQSSQSDDAHADAHDHWGQYLSASAQQLSPNTSSGISGVSGFAATNELPPATPLRHDSKREGEWRGLNDLLRKNGLPVIRFRDGGGSVEPSIPDADSLFELIQDFVVQLDRKNEIIQDLVLESKRNSRVQSKTEGTLASVEKKSQEVQSALDSARAEISRLKKKLKEGAERSELQTKKLKAACVRLQQQIKVSEHRVKAKEVLVERMQQKLQQQVDKENLAKTRERQVFRQLQDRDPRRANARDNQSLETIRIFESQREQLQEEIDLLKTQVASLNAELRDKENYISRKAASESATPVWEEYDARASVSDTQSRRLESSVRARRARPGPLSVASDEMIFEQLETARREQELVAAKLRHREAAMIKKVTMIEQDLVTARETIAELKEENANLVLEADSRPSIRDYRLCQRRLHQLERQLADSKLALEEAHDLNDLRKYMSTQELVERDRLNHRLQLNRLSALPRETALEIVQEVCRILHLTDITLIAPSLQKLCNVVVAVPRMEKFIRDVCGFVFLHSNEDVAAQDMLSAQFELEHVLPTLQRWMSERKRLHALEGFQAAVITELCKRSIEPVPAPTGTDGCPVAQSQPATLANAAGIIAELVDLEKNVLQHREIYSQAAVELERRPSVLINQIVRHFSRLFQVASIEGVLPKINELYLFVNEMDNFLNVVRDSLGLKKQSSAIQCVNALREHLTSAGAPPEREHRRAGRDVDDDEDTENLGHGNAPPNYVVNSSSRKAVAARGGGDGLAGVRQVREMTILIRNLQRELGAASMQEILPRTKRLMELLSLSIHTTEDPDFGDE